MLISAPRPSMGNLGQQPQSRQQSWWDWFFRGGPRPGSPVREVGILSAKPTAAKQRGQFDSYTQARNAAWADEAYDAAADEDINPFAAQGSDSESLMGLAQAESNPIAKIEKALPPVDPPRPADNRGARLLVGSLALGGAIALAATALCGSGERRPNPRRRNG